MVGDDVALGAGLDAADGQHRGLAGAHLAGDDGLQPDDDHGGEHHRVDGGLRHGAVRAATVHGDPHAVGRGQRRPGAGADLSRRERQHVLAQGHIHPADQFRQPVFDHAAGAVSGLLGRLEQRDHGAGP